MNFIKRAAIYLGIWIAAAAIVAIFSDRLPGTAADSYSEKFLLFCFMPLISAKCISFALFNGSAIFTISINILFIVVGIATFLGKSAFSFRIWIPAHTLVILISAACDLYVCYYDANLTHG